MADELTETETMTGDRLRVPCGWEGLNRELWGFNGLCGLQGLEFNWSLLACYGFVGISSRDADGVC